MELESDAAWMESACLHMRLGDLEIADAMVGKMMELDGADRLGGSVLRGVLARRGAEDDE